MTVVKAWLRGGIQDPLSEPRMLCKDFLRVLFEGIVQNSNVSIFVTAQGGQPEVIGSPTEKAALVWGLKLGMDYATARSESAILQVDTFNSIKKRARVAVRLAESGKVRVHWKGAAEIILQESDKLLYPDNGAMPISPDDRSHLMNAIEGMASESLRCIAFAYMDVDAGDAADNHG